MLERIGRQNGVRFSEHDTARLFRAADLADAGSVDVLEASDSDCRGVLPLPPAMPPAMLPAHTEIAIDYN